MPLLTMSSPEEHEPLGTELEVPYHQKDEAKEMGALWDPVRKKWYARLARLRLVGIVHRIGSEPGLYRRWLGHVSGPPWHIQPPVLSISMSEPGVPH